MRILPGGAQEVAHESVTGRLLMDMGVNKPDFIPTILRLFREEAPLIRLLDLKGYKSKGIDFFTNNGNYRTVGSNHVQYPLEHADWRKFHFAQNTDGLTFVSDVYPTEPGKNGTFFYVWFDSNWAGYKEVIELADNDTQLYVIEDPQEGSMNTWRYKVKLVTNDRDDFVNVDLMEAEMEATSNMNLHEHDFSERGTEKYTFNGYGDCYLSLQRFKYSWSGTAKAMDKKGKSKGEWVEHNGQVTFLGEAQKLMMKRAAEYLNYQFIFGKQTVTTDTKQVLLKEDHGRDVMAGNGIMHANDGALEFPLQNGFTKKWLELFMQEIDGYVSGDNNGVREVMFMMAPKAFFNFQSAMGEMGVTMNANIEGSGRDKGIVDTYSFYELGGIRIIAERYTALASNRRPGIAMPDGTKSNEWDTFVMPLGLTTGGSPNYELIQLRPSTEGTVAGIDMGGNIATSVDGSSTHVLFQNGIISRIQPVKIYRPNWQRSNSVYLNRQG